MPDVSIPPRSATARIDGRVNVADRLAGVAAASPDATAVVCPRRFSPSYRVTPRRESGTEYAATTFAELDADATRIARGLVAWGVPPGTRLALLVRPGLEFVTLVFALLRAGVVTVLIDSGMGRRRLARHLAESAPEGFVAVPVAQAVRALLRHTFPRARWNVTVGRRWFWSGTTLEELKRRGDVGWAPPTNKEPRDELVGGAHPTDPAAIIFTSGSTGPAKGVLYTHRMFDTQVSEIQATYGLAPGGVDLACFPLFALFNSAMGVTTVLPEMDFSRPAAADPRKLLAAARDWQVTQAFASPTVWRNLSAHCAKTGERIESLRQIFSCGAPVSAGVLRATLACAAPDAKMHTPYGATECLPVSTIEAAEVLNETAVPTSEGTGVCVGRKFDSIDWRVIRITDDPIATIDEAEELPPGQIGELIVRGPQASPCYVTQPEENAVSKIANSTAQSAITWHRMGDVGYLDEQGRFWYCGRKSQRVVTEHGTSFTECVEAVFNAHPAVRRSALVGVGSRGRQTPVIVVEREQGSSNGDLVQALLQLARGRELTRSIRHVLVHSNLPVDVRHNAKINREQLSAWAAKRLRGLR